MLENYIGDIEYLLREQRFAEAAPLALALPHICAALAHADLVSSRAAYREWCEAWVRPLEDDTSFTVPGPAELERLAESYGIERELATPGVPALGITSTGPATPSYRPISPGWPSFADLGARRSAAARVGLQAPDVRFLLIDQQRPAPCTARRLLRPGSARD
jgi:hypothetical protein